MTALAGDAAAPAVADRGRLFGVPVFGALAVLGAVRLVDLATNGELNWTFGVNAVGGALVLAFNVLVVLAFLRRRRAIARTPSTFAHVAAVVASCSSFVTPFLLGSGASTQAAVAADVLQLLGLAWSVWSLRTLGRSFSVLAEARAVVDRGPYRWVRHPLYVGEVLATAGVVLHGPSYAGFVIVVVLIGLQVFRATREEAVLAEALPGYAEYRTRTARLLPGVF